MTRALAAGAALLALGAAACASDDGPAFPELLAVNGSASYALAVDRDALYWGGGEGTHRFSFGDAAVEAIGDEQPTLGIAVSGDRLFWAAPHGIMTSGADGSGAGPLIDEQRCVFAMAADDTTVYWGSAIDRGVFAWNWKLQDLHRVSSDEPNITGVAVRDGRVYWSSGAGYIASANADGSDRRTLAEDQSWPRSVAATRDAVYWVDADGVVFRTDLDGGAVDRIAQRGQVRGLGGVLAADDRDVYWVTATYDGYEGGLYRAGPETLDVELLAEVDATALVVDDHSAYWSTGDGEVFALELR